MKKKREKKNMMHVCMCVCVHARVHVWERRGSRVVEGSWKIEREERGERREEGKKRMKR